MSGAVRLMEKELNNYMQNSFNETCRVAIKKGGYKNEIGILDTTLRLEQELSLYEQAFIIQDPLFWQALGKALGWGFNLKKNPFDEDEIGVDRWLAEALNYFHLVLTGGNTEKWWQELLTNKP